MMDPKTLTEQDVIGETSEHGADPMSILDDLEDVGGFKNKLKQIGDRIKVRRAEGRSIDDLVGNFIFTGAPGTGKTTVARKMGQILYAYGILATDTVIVTSGQDMTGQYVGQTKVSVEEKMQAARGGVLFVDEAYDLGEGKFGKEALTKLLSMLTEPEHKKTVVVLAGYEAQMHDMLERNPGLKSRFTEFLAFPDWNSDKMSWSC